jgi:hypothetical protein
MEKIQQSYCFRTSHTSVLVAYSRDSIKYGTEAMIGSWLKTSCTIRVISSDSSDIGYCTDYSIICNRHDDCIDTAWSKW